VPFQTPSVPPQDPRLDSLRVWLRTRADRFGLRVDTLRPASADASFRRYFRLDTTDIGRPSLIAMDAPPDREDSAPFVQVARRFAQAGVCTPALVDTDLAAGYLLLGDLGSVTYADALSCAPDTQVRRMYTDAIDALVRIQQYAPADGLPPYDRVRLRTELQLFPDWYVQRHLGAALTDRERAALEVIFERLVAVALAQPQVDVHRDYHCRNLMVLQPAAAAHTDAGAPSGPEPCPERGPGILDFQDAVLGPITYDLVSLLRDAYVDWPEAQQIDWAVSYWEKARAAGLLVISDFGAFWQDFEWMGLQRHLKVLGIFARLAHRDGKDRYLADLPRVRAYARATAARYDLLRPLARLLDRLADAQPRSGLTF
jgi:hypothetical protein